MRPTVPTYTKESDVIDSPARRHLLTQAREPAFAEREEKCVPQAPSVLA